MLSNITWQGYWTTLVFITAIYYGWVYHTYFKGQLKFLLQRRPGKRLTPPLSPKESTGIQVVSPQAGVVDENGEDSLFNMPPEDSEERAVYTLTDELSAYLKEARKHKVIKEELLFSLRSIIKKYPSLKASQYQGSINRVLMSECQHICSVHLSQEDMVRVWLDV